MLSNDDIVSITQHILSTMLELEASLGDVELTCSGTGAAVTGCVQISGQWQGAVVLQGNQGLAKLFASRLFETPVDDVSEADVRDAFAEMTNMIGGNIKGNVPGPSFLSIPSVTTGNDFDFHLANAEVVRDVKAACDGQAFRILLCEENKALAGRRVSSR
jgi:chemotaxis protein CheX